MTSRHPIFFTVGPSEVFPSVPKHIEAAIASGILSLSHRGKGFQDIFRSVRSSLAQLLALPEGYEIFFVSSGNEGMERFIQNCVLHTSGHLVYGAFSKKWSQISHDLGKRTEVFAVSDGDVPDTADVAFSPDVEAVCITQNETSTGCAILPSDIAALHARYPEMLIGIDVVSSAPMVEFDFSTVDCAFFSVQKCFGLPAGLGALIVSPRALARAGEIAKSGSIGSFHNFLELKKYADQDQTPETPNVLGIYLFSKILEEMRASGLDGMRHTIRERAEALYSLFESDPIFTPFVPDKRNRSITTLVIAVEGGSARMIKALAGEGIMVGAGYGGNKDKHIRIGNFPAHTDANFQALLAALGSSLNPGREPKGA